MDRRHFTSIFARAILAPPASAEIPASPLRATAPPRAKVGAAIENREKDPDLVTTDCPLAPAYVHHRL